MADIIVLLIVAALLVFALKGAIRHFKGEGPCCGGGSGGSPSGSPRQKKMDGPVMGKKTVKIQGMHCDHCVASVTEAINSIDGASAKVDLKKEEAVVSYDRTLDDDKIRKAVEKAGFKVVSISV
mgnify:FL=1